MKAVVANNISKTYTTGNKAVDNVSFELEQGSIFGFLGPNGAGKTTTVKLLCGMLTATSGSCRVFGIDPSENPEELHQISGVVTEHAQMYDHLSGTDNLIFYGTLFGMTVSESEKRAKSILEMLDLKEAGSRKLSEYSTGMRQRLSLARAMIHSPKILFLDETTSGLDPESAQNVNSIIRALSKNGTTVFLCTHQLRYAEEVCTDYGLMTKGHLLASGNIDELRAMVSSSVSVRVKTDKAPMGRAYRKIGENTYEINVESENEIPDIVRETVNAGGNLYHISSEKMSLEKIYFSLIEKCSDGKEKANS